jgi:hypothetical protein
MSRKHKPRVAALHAHFLSLVPRIELHGRIYFRGLKCRFRQEDLIAELVALCWAWYLRLARRGKDVTEFFVTFCRLAGRAVKSGRRVAGQESVKDVLCTQAQERGGFDVEKLPDVSTLSTNPLAEALTDNTQTPPPDAAAFRIDFPRWLRSWGGRYRRIIEDLAFGERTLDVARRFGLSPARVSQLRRHLYQDWDHFTADPGNERPADGQADQDGR